MSLLSEHDATLIFEQPELHLHPKVQSRLADFFLSIIWAGKQCLIETHSEYFINKLRYRAAIQEDGKNQVIGNLKIYFVEKVDGSSVFRELEVSGSGAIVDWPEGFFDLSQIESKFKLRAGPLKKPKAER
jgi:predicted ATPase